MTRVKRHSLFSNGGVPEEVDGPSLGLGGPSSPWGFKSPHPHPNIQGTSHRTDHH